MGWWVNGASNAETETDTQTHTEIRQKPKVQMVQSAGQPVSRSTSNRVIGWSQVAEKRDSWGELWKQIPACTAKRKKCDKICSKLKHTPRKTLPTGCSHCSTTLHHCTTEWTCAIRRRMRSHQLAFYFWLFCFPNGCSFWPANWPAKRWLPLWPIVLFLSLFRFQCVYQLIRIYSEAFNVFHDISRRNQI